MKYINNESKLNKDDLIETFKNHIGIFNCRMYYATNAQIVLTVYDERHIYLDIVLYVIGDEHNFKIVAIELENNENL